MEEGKKESHLSSVAEEEVVVAEELLQQVLACLAEAHVLPLQRGGVSGADDSQQSVDAGEEDGLESRVEDVGLEEGDVGDDEVRGKGMEVADVAETCDQGSEGLGAASSGGSLLRRGIGAKELLVTE